MISPSHLHRASIAAAALILVLLAALPTGAHAAAHVPGTLVVAYEPGTTGAQRDAIRKAAGVHSSGFVSSASQRVTVDGDRDVREVAAKLESDPRVRHASPNYVARSSAFVPDDPGRAAQPTGWRQLQWNFTGPYGIGVEQAWQNAIASGGEGGNGVTIAVLDTGVAYRNSPNGHFRRSPDLGRQRFVRGYDFVRRNRLPYDRNGHGTFVAGTLAQQTNNGLGVTGIAYRSRLMPVRVLDYEGSGDVATIARGIRFAARNGAQVMNMSFEFSIGLTASQIPDIISALQFAMSKGVVMVGASGNGDESHIAYPARASNVISVGATTKRGCLADYSNRGGGLDLVAPGGGADALIFDDPHCDTDEPARDIYQYTFLGTNPRVFGLPGGYEGTSMSAPHVAGTAALIIGQKLLGEDPSPTEIAQRLTSTARDLGVPGHDRRYGWGLLDAAAATAPGPVPAPAPAPAPAPVQ